MRLRIHAHLVQHEGQPFQVGIADSFQIPHTAKPPVLIFLLRQDAGVDEHIHRRGISAHLKLMVHGAVDLADQPTCSSAGDILLSICGAPSA